MKSEVTNLCPRDWSKRLTANSGVTCLDQSAKPWRTPLAGKPAIPQPLRADMGSDQLPAAVIEFRENVSDTRRQTQFSSTSRDFGKNIIKRAPLPSAPFLLGPRVRRGKMKRSFIADEAFRVRSSVGGFEFACSGLPCE